MKLSQFALISTLVLTSCAKHDHKKYQQKSMDQIRSNEFWWPNKVDLSPLRTKAKNTNPYAKDFNYAKEFAKLNLADVKKDITKLLTTSQDWWPADYGNYGPFFIRMAWHSAGTYRVTDGRGGGDGGQMRFEPLNSWPDNANLDKARRLLCPIKKKYGNKISWSDLFILSGNVVFSQMGFKTIGFAGGRVDDWEAELVNWGSEHKFLASKRHDKKGDLKKPFGATQMGLIYVNPEGPNGNPDPLLAAKDIRETFARMAMNDEETVALIAGGHTFGKMHGAHKAEKCLDKEPAAAGLEEQGLGWKNKCGKGYGVDTVTSGLEGAWTSSQTKFTMEYLNNLFAFDWKKTKSPAGATLWIPTDENAKNLVPDAHDINKRHAPVMLTTDLSLKFDPEYRKIAKRFQENPSEFEKAFAKAWFKLTHRDMGPSFNYIGKDAPKEQFVWQDPLPKVNYNLINAAEVEILKKQILQTKIAQEKFIKAAWAAAATYRNTDKRGGANGARISLEPQKNWLVNNPQELNEVLSTLERVRTKFNKNLTNNKKVSLADTIVIAGAGALEKSARETGFNIKVPVTLGRVDALQDHTDVNSFAYLELKADGFRNYLAADYKIKPVNALIEKAQTLDLSIPEMTVLVGGMRSLNANSNNSAVGILTSNPGKLSNDFFVNLLDNNVRWRKSADNEGLYEGFDIKTKQVKWLASPVDLVFGSSSELRAVAEYYALDGNNEIFIKDFIRAWNKVMNLDRFDLK